MPALIMEVALSTEMKRWMVMEELLDLWGKCGTGSCERYL